MARFRCFDPQMMHSPQMDGLEPLDLVVHDRLLLSADDDGRMLGDDRSIWTHCFPRDNSPGVTRSGALASVEKLATRRLVVLYEVRGQRYLAITGWKDGDSCQYQHIKKMVPSRLPPPPEGTCPVKPRGRGAPPSGRGAAAAAPEVDSDPASSPNQSGTSTVPVRAELDWTGRGREPDTDTDRTGKRASPAPSPAGAGSGSARSEGAAKAGPKDMLAMRGAIGAPPDADEAHRKLLTRLFDSYRGHTANGPESALVRRALALQKKGDPEFARVANQALLALDDAKRAALEHGDAESPPADAAGSKPTCGDEPRQRRRGGGS